MQPIDSLLSFSGVEVPWALMVSMSPGDREVVERRRIAATMGAPSGLDRVRWEAVAAFARAEHIAEDRRRAPARSASSNEGRAALAHDEAVAVLGERLRRPLRRIVLRRQGREEREADEIPGSRNHRCRCRAQPVSPRRIASTPSWIAVAPDEQAVESEIGEPLVPKLSATRSATVPKMKRSCHALKRPVPAAFRRSS